MTVRWRPFRCSGPLVQNVIWGNSYCRTSFQRKLVFGVVRRNHFQSWSPSKLFKARVSNETDNNEKRSGEKFANTAEGLEDNARHNWQNIFLNLTLPIFTLWILHHGDHISNLCRKVTEKRKLLFTNGMAAVESNIIDFPHDNEISIDDLVTETTDTDQNEEQKDPASEHICNKNSVDDNCYQSLGDESGMVIFSGTSNVELAREVCAHLNLSLSRLHLARFADGEISVKILDDVRSRDVYVFQSMPSGSDGKCVHSQFMELFLTISALRRASSERITAVIPYLGYSRQNDVDSVNPKPLAVADVSNILHSLGVDRVIFVDHHAPRATAFFPDLIPVTNVSPHRLAIRYLTKLNLQSPVVVSTENTGTERAKLFWSRMKKHVHNTGLATIVTNRPRHLQRTDDDRETSDPATYLNIDGTEFSTGKERSFFIGDVRDRDCVIVDNIVDSGIRVSSVANACRAAGARRIFVYVTHGILSKGAVDRLDSCEAEEVLVTNTIELPKGVCSDKIRVLNISGLLAEVIRRLHAEALPDFTQKSIGGIGDLYRESDFDASQMEESHKD